MNKLENILAALTPKRWPVRWRLAAVSATLTLIILVVFAVVVGRLVSNRLNGDFNDELRDTGDRLAPGAAVHGAEPHVSPESAGRWPPAPRRSGSSTGTETSSAAVPHSAPPTSVAPGTDR